MADTENREDQKISECLREAFGYSDDQLLKQLDQANETFKDVNFTGAEDRLMKRFLARKAELEKETASQTPTLVPQNESANIQIAEELPKKTVTVISEAEEKKKNEKKVIRKEEGPCYCGVGGSDCRDAWGDGDWEEELFFKG